MLYAALVLYPIVTVILFMELDFFKDPYIAIPVFIATLSIVLYMVIGIVFDKTGILAPEYLRTKPEDPHDVQKNNKQYSDFSEMLDIELLGESEVNLIPEAQQIARTYRHPYHDAYQSIEIKQ